MRFIGVSQTKNHQKSKENTMEVFHFTEMHLKSNHFLAYSHVVLIYLTQSNIKIFTSQFRQKEIQIFKQTY